MKRISRRAIIGLALMLLGLAWTAFWLAAQVEFESYRFGKSGGGSLHPEEWQHQQAPISSRALNLLDVKLFAPNDSFAPWNIHSYKNILWLMTRWMYVGAMIFSFSVLTLLWFRPKSNKWVVANGIVRTIVVAGICLAAQGIHQSFTYYDHSAPPLPGYDYDPPPRSLLIDLTGLSGASIQDVQTRAGDTPIFHRWGPAGFSSTNLYPLQEHRFVANNAESGLSYATFSLMLPAPIDEARSYAEIELGIHPQLWSTQHRHPGYTSFDMIPESDIHSIVFEYWRDGKTTFNDQPRIYCDTFTVWYRNALKHTESNESL